MGRKLYRASVKILLLVLLLTVFRSSALCEDFSRVGFDARAQGMGRATLALENDLNSCIANPAALRTVEGIALSSLYMKLHDDVSYVVAGLSVPFSGGVVSFRMISVGVDDIYTTYRDSELPWNPDDLTIGRIVAAGSFDYFSNIYTLGVSRMIGSDLSIGLAGKVFHKSMEKVSSGNAQGWECDLGILYTPDYLPADLALVIRDCVPGDNLFWKSGTEERIPYEIAVGAALQPLQAVTAAVECSMTEDMIADGAIVPVWKAGLEGSLMNYLKLRAGGYEFLEKPGFKRTFYSLGVGLEFGGMRLDYAFRPGLIVDNNNLHFFSLGITLH